MKRTSILLLSTLLLSSQAQDCNNPLLGTFNLTGLDAATSGAGLPYCQDLQAGQTCCSNETVSQFQNLINDVQQAILGTAGQRDQNIANLRNNVLNNYDNDVDRLSDFSDDIDNLVNANADIGNEVRNQLNLFKGITDRLDDIDSDDEFSDAINDYQRKRVRCFNTLLQVQASAWCLACNPNYASQGVAADGSIAFSDDLRNTIVSDCLPFTERGQTFNPLFQADQSSQRVQNLITYMQAFKDNNNAVPNQAVSNDVNINSDPTQRTNTVPEGCSGNNCAFQSDNLFTNGVLNETFAANGAGIIGGEDITLNNVGVETAPPARLLQNTGTWNPDLAQSGVQLNVVADPGQVSGLPADGGVLDGGLSSVRVVASGLTLIALIMGMIIV